MKTKLITTARSLFILAFMALMLMLAIPQTSTPLENLIGGWWSSASASAKLHSAEKPLGLSSEIEVVSNETVSAADQRPLLLSESLKEGRLKGIQDRLKQLGASYMAMEKISETNPAYRFVCQMPLPESSAYSRKFEEIDVDPLRAMEQVLREIEKWSSAQNRSSFSHASPVGSAEL